MNAKVLKHAADTRALPVTISDDLLEGAEAIAAFLGLQPRQVFHAVRVGTLPTFKIGAKICARRSTLLSHIERMESATAA